MFDALTEHVHALDACNQRGGRMLSLIDLLDAGTVDLPLAAYLAAAMRHGASLLVGARPGGAGKTAVMVALLNFLPAGTAIRAVGSRVVSEIPHGLAPPRCARHRKCAPGAIGALMSFYAEFAEHYEAIFPFDETVYARLRRYILPEHRRCLDVGCGTGHYCGRLAADGFAAVGLDLDAAMIAHARQRYPQATFHVLNMLDIVTLLARDHNPALPQQDNGRFDAAFCIGNTAAHLTPAQFAQFLDRAQDALKPGAPWILQVMNWDFVLERESFTFPLIEAPQGLTFHREYRMISEAQVTFHTRLQSGANVIFEDETPLYPLRARDIARLHHERGFSPVGHFGSYAGAPFAPAVFSANILVWYR